MYYETYFLVWNKVLHYGKAGNFLYIEVVSVVDLLSGY